MGWSIKKPLGGSNSAVRRTIKNPTAAVLGFGLGSALPGIGGPTGAALGAALNDTKRNMISKANDPSLNVAPGSEPDIRGEYEGLANRYSSEAAPLRQRLADSLSSSGSALFKKVNPYLLEDLNARGLFTSESAVGKEQADALAEIAADDRSTLNDFDTDVFNQVQNIRATGLGTSLQRVFDEKDAARQESMMRYLARRSSRDNLISSLLGLGGRLGSGAIPLLA